MPKSERKKYGQFFTSKETAIFMSSLFDIPNKENIRVLDTGAGAGILTATIVDRINRMEGVRKVDIVCIENDPNILELLNDNLQYLRKVSKYTINYTILNKNFIVDFSQDFNSGINSMEQFDLIIGNPPYKKLNKLDPEAQAMSSIVYGSPNLYFLFMAMSIHNLKRDGELVYIIPRSWTSGAYFKKFREYLFNNISFEHFHLFVSRNKVFSHEKVLQETMIVKVRKSKTSNRNITITSSLSNDDFHNIERIEAEYDLIASSRDNYIYLITNAQELSVLKKVNGWKTTLPDLGLKMKTGITVDFRNRDCITDEKNSEVVPLIYSRHISNGEIEFPKYVGGEYLIPKRNGLIQKNKNYLMVKRFTSKEEKRRLQCAIYLAKDFPEYDYISTQNKVNFIDSVIEMSECVVYGLYVLFNSTLYDVYYRVLNGSTQVNSTEMNNIPVPDIDVIKKLGNALSRSKDLSEENCNKILEVYGG